MSALEVGRIYERDGLQRRVQAVRPPSRREPNGAVEWHRPGNDWSFKTTSLQLWDRWQAKAVTLTASTELKP